jgi:P-type Cu+ transporter
VVRRADGQTCVHEHGEVEEAKGRPVFALPGHTFDPGLDVHAEFDTPVSTSSGASFGWPPATS